MENFVQNILYYIGAPATAAGAATVGTLLLFKGLECFKELEPNKTESIFWIVVGVIMVVFGGFLLIVAAWELFPWVWFKLTSAV